MPKEVADDTEIKASVPLKPDVHAKISALAKADGRSLGRYIAKLVEAHTRRVA